MALVRWNPTRDLDALQGDVNRLFDSFFGTQDGNGTRANRWIPPMDLSETDDELVLRLDLPGVSKEDLEIEVRDGTLIIQGTRETEDRREVENYLRLERSFGRFSRSVELPSSVDPDGVNARFDSGVLELRMPKPEEHHPHRIEIVEGGAGERSE